MAADDFDDLFTRERGWPSSCVVRHQAVLRAAARRRGRRARALGLAVLAGAAGAAVVVAAVALVRPDHERVDTGPVASYA